MSWAAWRIFCGYGSYGCVGHCGLAHAGRKQSVNATSIQNVGIGHGRAAYLHGRFQHNDNLQSLFFFSLVVLLALALPPSANAVSPNVLHHCDDVNLNRMIKRRATHALLPCQCAAALLSLLPTVLRLWLELLVSPLIPLLTVARGPCL